jgi:dTDP-4-dehydrorhamnose 3,5-epimerase-like enzyme
VEVENFIDDRGALSISNLPNFELKRIYYISSVPANTLRGAHAHKKLKQIFFALSGKFNLRVTDGVITEEVELSAFGPGYFLSEGYWRELSNFSPDAVCLVLASEHYDENDYIHSYDEYLDWKKIE